VARRGAGLLALTAALLLAACGGGGGGGGGGGPTQPQPSITFAPSGSATGIVLASGAATTTTTLVLEVDAVQVTGLFGVAFDLDYPTSVLRFAGFKPGTFLANGGAQLTTQVVETAPGHLVVGVSRLGNVSGVDGGGTILELDFTATAAGSGNLAFSKNNAYRNDATPLTLGWGAGSVTVVQ